MRTKETKRAEANERNAAWAALPFETKLARLHRRPGSSQRQRDRIMAPITAKKRKIAAARWGETS